VFTHIGVFAAEWIPTNKAAVDPIYASAGLPVPDTANSDQLIGKVVMSALNYTKVIVVVIGILFITVMGYTLITNSSNEEQITTVKRGMIYILIAFMMISMSQEIAKIFDFSNATLLQSPTEILKRVQIWDKQVGIMIKFIKYIIASFACVMIVRSSIKLITAGGEDEETTKHKKSIAYSAGGLLLVYVGDIFINKVFYVVNKTKYTPDKGIDWKVDAGQGVQELVGITNMAVTFVAPLAVLMLIIAAVMYLAAAGEEEKMNKAKRIIFATIVGVLLVYGAFAIVSTIVSGSLPPNLVPDPTA
jgi:hypothetical protein